MPYELLQNGGQNVTEQQEEGFFDKMKDAFGGKKKNKTNESETKAVSSKCSSLSKAKLQRVIVGSCFCSTDYFKI